MKKTYFLFIPLLIFLLSNVKREQFQPTLANTDSDLASILTQLGDTPLPHQPDTSFANVSAEQGKALVLTGFAQTTGGDKTSKQSAHFVCTSCHNIQRDEPDLTKTDPQARLEYVEKMGLPFLQGSALYGIVNRTSFYNGDYYKKYGDLVKPARNNIREAIQLCAVECAQGRKLETWEMESILAYLWTIGLKLGDLNLSDSEYAQINSALAQQTPQTEAVSMLKSKYLTGMPATFVTPPTDWSAGYVEEGNPSNGKRIYDLSCLHCHQEMRYSFFELDQTKATFQFLTKHIARYTRYSIYQVTRWGTAPIPGKRAYMPQYTLEKMSNQQLEDLRAYLEQEAQ
jgi:mono/diheme cytochrome c family protein